MSTSESEGVKQRYERRKSDVEVGRYSFLSADVWQGVQERQRAMLILFKQLGMSDLGSLKLLEVGCGAGGNLLELLRMGFRPENIKGLELLQDRVDQANRLLPQGIVEAGDANAAMIQAGSVDIVFLSTVFSSLLDDAFQEELAARLWAWAKPGGGVLWYDFVYNNPSNPDVRGVPLKRIEQLFPSALIRRKRVTLAPPIARRIVKIHPALYTVANVFPFLRTHVLCWIQKP